MQEGDRLLNFCVMVVSGEVDTLTTVRFEIVPGSGTASKCIGEYLSLTIAQDYPHKYVLFLPMPVSSIIVG